MVIMNHMRVVHLTQVNEFLCDVGRRASLRVCACALGAVEALALLTDGRSLWENEETRFVFIDIFRIVCLIY